MSDHAREPITDHLEMAKNLVERIGGFNGISANDLAESAIACALISIAEDVRQMRIEADFARRAGMKAPYGAGGVRS